jgi:hypothetical protein
MTKIKLSKTQQQLIQKLQSGEELYYHPYMGSFNRNAYFTCEWMRCTASATALIAKGLVEGIGTWKKEYSLTQAGKDWKTND